ncbi:MAG: DUF2079 domain-containing protein [Acidimicrobiales bacterium]
MAVPLRRRLDNLSLRWQARLDSEWADRVLPWAASAGLFVLLAALSLAKARSLDGTLDLAGYTQAAWLIGEGAKPVVTVTTDAHVLAQQASFIFYPVTLVTYVVPIIPALLLVQSAALAVAMVPLWWICRRLANLRTGATLVLLFVYACYPVMHNLNLDGFHPETLALPALLGAMYYGLRGRWWPFAACCAVVLLARADLGLAVAGLGGLLAAQGHRRAGFTTLGVGLGWTIVCTAMIQPFFGDGSYAHVGAFAQFGATPLSILGGMITHPLDVLGRITSEQNFQLFLVLFAPVAFLPVLAPRYLVPVLPLQFLYLTADVPRDAVFGQQTVAITAFIFLAAAFALARIGRMGVEKVHVDRRVLGALLLAGTVFFIGYAASSPYRQPWNWGGQDVVDYARIQAADRVQPGAAVRVSPSMATLLATRPTIHVIEAGDKPDAAQAAEGVDVIVLDDRQVPQWDDVERQVFRLGLDSLGFQEVSADQGIELFVRRGSDALRPPPGGSA